MSGTSTTDFYNIDITNTSLPGVTIESDQNIHGVLTMGANAILDADGVNDLSVLTLISSADNPTEDAAVGVLPSGAAINGNVTVERFMTKEGKRPGEDLSLHSIARNECLC